MVSSHPILGAFDVLTRLGATVRHSAGSGGKAIVSGRYMRVAVKRKSGQIRKPHIRRLKTALLNPQAIEPATTRRRLALASPT